MNSSRRSFLSFVLAGFGFLRRSPVVSCEDASHFGISLLGVVRSADSAAVIGERYLSQGHAHDDAVSLAGTLHTTFLGDSSNEEPHSWFHKRVKRDFANRKVVSIDGWVLSETEARLCALAALA